MAAAPLKILIVDDDEGDRKHLERALKHSGLVFESKQAITVEEALSACENVAFDCAFVDYRIPGQDGLSGVSALVARQPYMAIIMLTGHGDERIAAEAIKRGASDYIPKMEITPEAMFRAVANAAEQATLRRKIDQQRQELRDFVHVLVHDLKSPIQTVRGFVKLIDRNVQAGNLADVPEYTDLAVKGVERMAALIDALYSYTMTDTPRGFEPLEMRQVVEDTLKSLELLIRERGARVTHAELPSLVGDAPQLSQLLQNLIANGIKYCQVVPQIHIAADQRGGDWLFSVRDNGIGIAEEFLEQIFQPFKRLHGVGEYEGSGLGLATCQKIVTRHHGRIWCESKEGHGTTFFFTFGAGTED